VANHNAYLTSAAYNPVAGELLVIRGTGGGTNRVYRLKGFAAGQPPPPPPPPSPTGTLTANPATVVAGDPVTVTWTWANADTATITPRIGQVTLPAGSQTDRPDTDTTYTLTVTNATGSNTYTAAVTVLPAPPPPPPNPCVVNPIVITGVTWPGNAEGSRQGRFTWSVANEVVTLVKMDWDYSGASHSLTITDSRGCTTKYDRP